MDIHLDVSAIACYPYDSENCPDSQCRIIEWDDAHFLYVFDNIDPLDLDCLRKDSDFFATFTLTCNVFY